MLFVCDVKLLTTISQFYLVNYLEWGKNWEDIARERDDGADDNNGKQMGEAHDHDNDDDDDVDDGDASHDSDGLLTGVLDFGQQNFTKLSILT